MIHGHCLWLKRRLNIEKFNYIVGNISCIWIMVSGSIDFSITVCIEEFEDNDLAYSSKMRLSYIIYTGFGNRTLGYR